MSSTFYPKNKLDFENYFKQYITQVNFGDDHIIKRKRIHSDNAKESNIKRRKINSIDKEKKSNKNDAELANCLMGTDSDSLPSKDSTFNNRYYPTKRKYKITNLKRRKSTKNVAHVPVPDEPVVKRNFKTHEMPKPYAPLNAEFKVVRQNYNNFTVVSLINNEAKVERNYPVNGETNVNGILYTILTGAKINYNNFNVIPITNANFNFVQNNSSNLSAVPFTNTESVLDQFIANEVPESKDATNVNPKLVELNYGNLNPVPVMNGETNEASKSNGASYVNFKADTYNFLVNKNFPENEMLKSKSSASIDFKVNQVSSDNFTNVPVLNHQMVENKVSKCAKVQNVDLRINEKTKDGGVLVDYFIVVSEDNITNRAELNENCLLTNKSDPMKLDEEFDMNLDFLNETEDFAVNFSQLINMVEDCHANTSINLDKSQDSKKNCDLESYLAMEEFNSYITF